MGFDITFHTIRRDALELRYLSRLPEVARGDESGARQVAADAGLSAESLDTYLYILQTGAKKDPADPALVLENTHAYFACAVSGLFDRYWYARDACFTFLLEDPDTAPLFQGAFSTWRDLAPELPGACEGRIPENWAAGAVASPAQCRALASSIAAGDERGQAIARHFGPFLPSLTSALQAAVLKGAWLAEATEVIEPDPMDPGASECVSDAANCDPAGLKAWHELALAQLREAGWEG